MNIDIEIQLLRALVENLPTYRQQRQCSSKGGKGGQAVLIVMPFQKILTDKSREMRLDCLKLIFPFGPSGPVTSTNSLSDAETHVLINYFYDVDNGEGVTASTQLSAEAWSLIPLLEQQVLENGRQALIAQGQLELPVVNPDPFSQFYALSLTEKRALMYGEPE